MRLRAAQGRTPGPAGDLRPASPPRARCTPAPLPQGARSGHQQNRPVQRPGGAQWLGLLAEAAERHKLADTSSRLSPLDAFLPRHWPGAGGAREAPVLSGSASRSRVRLASARGVSGSPPPSRSTCHPRLGLRRIDARTARLDAAAFVLPRSTSTPAAGAAVERRGADARLVARRHRKQVQQPAEPRGTRRARSRGSELSRAARAPACARALYRLVCTDPGMRERRSASSVVHTLYMVYESLRARLISFELS